MMSPDDEPSQSTNKTQTKNSLMNEAFNLTTSFSNFQPLTVLPPTSNHFQPIHSRTPSTEIKEPPKLLDSKQQLNSTVKNASPFSNTLSPSSFFDQPGLAAKPFNPLLPPTQTDNTFQTFQPLNTETKPDNNPASLFTPVPPKPVGNLFQNQTSSPLTGLSNLPPPSAVPPPLSKPTNTTSNPYAAKGALNKKVYDNVVPIAPLPNSNTTPALFLSPQIVAEQQQVQPMPQVDMFTPIAKSASNTSLTQSFNSTQIFNSPPVQLEAIQQPVVNLDQRMSTSMSLNYENTLYSNPAEQHVQQTQQNQQNQQNKTMWNWFTQNKLVNTFVEKAKYGVETIVTTVDPQMKDYIHPANRPFYIVSSISNPKLMHTIRESFNNAGFSKITLSATDAQNSSAYAPQIVGFPCALQSAKEKLENTLFAMQQTLECVVISFQDFLAELSTDCWFELAVIMLKDKANNIDLTIYTEAVPISNEDISQLQQYTPADFNLSWSGYAVRLPEKNFNFNGSNSSNSSTRCFLNYETQDTVLSQARLSHALHSLAILFKNKLLAQIKQ